MEIVDEEKFIPNFASSASMASFAFWCCVEWRRLELPEPDESRFVVDDGFGKLSKELGKFVDIVIRSVGSATTVSSFFAVSAID